MLVCPWLPARAYVDHVLIFLNATIYAAVRPHRCTVPQTLKCWPHANIIAAQYWERKKLENARHGRRLGEPMSMGELILGVRRINIFCIRTSRYYALGGALNAILCWVLFFSSNNAHSVGVATSSPQGDSWL